jgi:uncharacterized protein YndB with AHSA1/START domain
MTEFSIAVDIAAPPERVWAVLSDVERWSEWTPSVTRIERLDHGPLVVGSRARIRQPGLLPATWEVTELRDGHDFTWVTRSPGVRVAGRHGVEPSPQGSRATLSVQFSGALARLVARVTRRLNERYLALEAQGLARRSAQPEWSLRAGVGTVAR